MKILKIRLKPLNPQATFLPAHKEMVNFIHTNDLMKDPLEVVDEHINTFIHIGRCIWDMNCFIFYGDPIYNIEGTLR
jgi:hypothetical protein